VPPPRVAVAAIAAACRGPDGAPRAIGVRGGLPWGPGGAPEDMAWFRAATAGRAVAFGATTWRGLPRRPLPGRRCLVLTRSDPGAPRPWLDGTAGAFASIGELLAAEAAHPTEGDAGDPRPVLWIAGGAAVYAAALRPGPDGQPPPCTALFLTVVGVDAPGADAFLPDLGAGWVEISRSRLPPAGDGIGPPCELAELRWGAGAAAQPLLPALLAWGAGGRAGDGGRFSPAAAAGISGNPR